jgi:phage terminase large subunit
VTVRAGFSARLKPLFEPYRYKVLHGGRGSGKSWAVARALLIQAARKPLRILCSREVQKSIKESVHQLLCDQIQALGFGERFRVLETEIRGINGSRFAFSGLASHTVESIKSYEGYDLVWVEEAQTVSKRSWDILTPTIRKPGSEIWMTLNPWLSTDETYKRFVLAPPPDAWTLQVNFHDNPWFPDVLEQERAHCEATRPADEYRNIWLGEPRRTADGAYYADQMAVARGGGRIRQVVHTATTPVNTFWDLGWNDTTAIWWHQYVAGEDRFLRCYEASGESLSHFAQVIQDAGYAYDVHYLPHDAENKSLQTGKSTYDLLRELLPGHRFEIVQRVEDVLEGINATRLRLEGPVFFDATGCESGIVALENYRKEWDPKLEVFRQKPLHDRYSNLADAFRQWAQGFRAPRAERSGRKRKPNRSWKVA